MSAAITYGFFGGFAAWIVYGVARDMLRNRRVTRGPVRRVPPRPAQRERRERW